MENNTYKWISLVLAIVAIVFAVLYFTKPSEPVSETFNDISAQAQMCRDEVSSWQARHGAQATTTQAQRDELSSILDECRQIFENVEEKI